MSKKNKKSKSKKNNKKRLAIILSSILGTGILVTAITLPIVLTRKGNKDGGGNVGPLDYLDHFEKEITNITDLTNMDPHLDIFKDLTLDISKGQTDCTQAIISNIYSNYDETTAKEKIEEFLKYLLFENVASSWNSYLWQCLVWAQELPSITINYKLNKLEYEYSSTTFNFSFDITSTFSWKTQADWGELTKGIPEGKKSNIFITQVLSYKSYNERTLTNGINLFFKSENNLINTVFKWKNGEQFDDLIDFDDKQMVKQCFLENVVYKNEDNGDSFSTSTGEGAPVSGYVAATYMINLCTYSKPNEWKLSDGLKGITFKTQ